jgi:hypothetical protein
MRLRERSERDVQLSEKKYIDIRCMRALRRNRFLSECKFEYAWDDANGWMREKMVAHAETRKVSEGRGGLWSLALLHRGDPNNESIFPAPLFSFLLFL